tara:strand:+ start:8624 stop:9382 length:759 start_codon:yes stop_codon:yes gene_type:complete
MNKQATYGIHAVKQLLKHRASDVEEVFVLSGRTDGRMHEIVSLSERQGISLSPVDKKEIDNLVSGKHQGVVAIVKSNVTESDNLMSEQQLYDHLSQIDAPLFLVLDGVTDPHNLGACLRTAEAAGVNAVIIPKDKSAGLNPTVRKVASGAAESIPLVTVTNLARALEKLKALGVWIVGTDDGTTSSIFQQELTGSLAIVMGSEGKGLRRLTREKCDFLVSIPMAGEISSLNVSVAAGVALFEAVRQRGDSQK